MSCSSSSLVSCYVIILVAAAVAAAVTLFGGAFAFSLLRKLLLVLRCNVAEFTKRYCWLTSVFLLLYPGAG